MGKRRGLISFGRKRNKQKNDDDEADARLGPKAGQGSPGAGAPRRRRRSRSGSRSREGSSISGEEDAGIVLLFICLILWHAVRRQNAPQEMEQPSRVAS